jgi:hypothetical protein
VARFAAGREAAQDVPLDPAAAMQKSGGERAAMDVSAMDNPVWCIRCSRVWDEGDLTGRWPKQVCPDAGCNGGQPGTFLPYHRTRLRYGRLAPDWPETPERGQAVRLLLGGDRPRPRS